MPLCLQAPDFTFVRMAIENDTTFLKQLGLMDYSLLVLLCRNPGPIKNTEFSQLVTSTVTSSQQLIGMGIIDYLRPYTWDKQVETLAKSVVAQSGTTPSVIEPKLYADRLLKAIVNRFIAEPP